MAYGACSNCGCAYAECECAQRMKAQREDQEAQIRARKWVEQGYVVERRAVSPRRRKEHE